MVGTQFLILVIGYEELDIVIIHLANYDGVDHRRLQFVVVGQPLQAIDQQRGTGLLDAGGHRFVQL